MKNLEIYEKVRKVPNEAIRPIAGGKLKGKSDINPMWRIKKLTELFGPCGIGWYTEKLSEKIITLSNGEIIILIEINLFIKQDSEWQKPIYGTGGSMLFQFEKGKLVSNDEGMKMAYTDAISVACKALGVAADVYWNSDRTKYDGQQNTGSTGSPPPTNKVSNPPPPEKEINSKIATLKNQINKLSKECDTIAGTAQMFYYDTVIKNLGLDKKSPSEFTIDDLSSINSQLFNLRNNLGSAFGGSNE